MNAIINQLDPINTEHTWHVYHEDHTKLKFSILSFIHQIFLECPVFAIHCSRHVECTSQQNRQEPGLVTLVFSRERKSRQAVDGNHREVCDTLGTVWGK